MSNLYLNILIVFIAIGNFTPVIAKDRPLRLKDAGALSCSESINIYEKTGNEIEKTAILQWLSGYAVAQAEARKVIDIFPIIDSEEFVRMVLLVCTEARDSRLKIAAEEAVSRLKPVWVAASSSFVSIEDGGGTSLLFTEAVIPIQILLGKNGFNILIDGIYQKQTRESVDALHAKAGFPAAQRPTGFTIYLLTLPQ